MQSKLQGLHSKKKILYTQIPKLVQVQKAQNQIPNIFLLLCYMQAWKAQN